MVQLGRGLGDHHLVQVRPVGDEPRAAPGHGLGEIEESALSVRVEHPSFEDWWEPYMAGVGPAGAYVARLLGGRGATIVSHTTARPMLERVIARRWTREPDALEESPRREEQQHPVDLNVVGGDQAEQQREIANGVRGLVRRVRRKLSEDFLIADQARSDPQATAWIAATNIPAIMPATSPT